MLSTLCQSDFKEWVQAMINERNDGLAEEDHVEMDRDVYEAYQRSNAVSCMFLFVVSIFQLLLKLLEIKGSGAHLLKPGSKRRRSKAEVLREREQERERQGNLERQAI